MVEPLEQLRRAQAGLAGERSRPFAVAARCSRWRTCVTPARESADACAAPMPSITSIFTAALRWLRGDVIRSARGVLDSARRRAGPGRAIPSSLRRGEACESFIGLPLHARRPRGAPRAAGGGPGRRPSRRHVRDARDLQRRHGRSAGQRHAAVLAALPGHAGRPDGVPQVLGPGGQQRRGRPRGQVAAHERRRPDVDAHAAPRRPLLQRRAGAAGRRALHVRAAVQGARPDRRVALRRHRRCRGVPAESRDLHARPRHQPERVDDHVPPHATRHRVAAEARAAAGGAAAAERGRRGDRHRRLAARRHRPVHLGVVRAGPAARAPAQPVLQGLGAGGAAGRLRRPDRAALRPRRRGRGHAGRARAGRLGRRRRAGRPPGRADRAASPRRCTSTSCPPTGTSRSTSTSSRSTSSRRGRPSTSRSTATRS